MKKTKLEKLQTIVSELQALPKVIKVNCACCGNEYEVETEVQIGVDNAKAWYKQKGLFCSDVCKENDIKKFTQNQDTYTYHPKFKNALITKSI